MALPHGAEAAIRAWGSADSEVYAVQVEVDRQRLEVLYESAFPILGSRRQAQLFANWVM